MQIHTAVYKNEVHFFDSKEAVDAITLLDSEWHASVSFVVEGTVINMIIRSKGWVDERYTL